MLIKTAAIFHRINRDSYETDKVLLTHRTVTKDYANQTDISTRDKIRKDCITD